MSRSSLLFSKALQPLVDRAEALECRERNAWFAELHRDCPIIARQVEQLVARDLVIDWREAAEPMHALDMLGLRR